MQKVRILRHAHRRIDVLGLEMLDLLAIASIATLFLFLGDFLGMVATVFSSYAGLRWWKRGKPRGFTRDVLRYAFAGRAYLSGSERDVRGRARSFSIRRKDF